MEVFDRRREFYQKERFDQFVRWVALRTVDDHWKDHLYEMDRLREGVGLRAYGQRDPLIEYKKEGFEIFSAMLDNIIEDTVRIVFNAIIQTPPEVRPAATHRMRLVKAEASRVTAQAIAGEEDGDGAPPPPPPQMSRRMGGDGGVSRTPVRVTQAVGRNEPCPCGSGKKYKKCHGANL